LRNYTNPPYFILFVDETFVVLWKMCDGRNETEECVSDISISPLDIINMKLILLNCLIMNTGIIIHTRLI